MFVFNDKFYGSWWILLRSPGCFHYRRCQPRLQTPVVSSSNQILMRKVSSGSPSEAHSWIFSIHHWQILHTWIGHWCHLDWQPAIDMCCSLKEKRTMLQRQTPSPRSELCIFSFVLWHKAKLCLAGQQLIGLVTASHGRWKFFENLLSNLRDWKSIVKQYRAETEALACTRKWNGQV